MNVYKSIVLGLFALFAFQLTSFAAASDGTLDSVFSTNLNTAFDGEVKSVSRQSDGKIIVGGNFTTFNGNTRNYLVRLNSDGTEDTSFYTSLGSGFNNTVYATAVQSDGKILVGGEFDELNGISRTYFVRLNSNGTVDTTFYTALGSGFNSIVSAILVQSDGKILVGGAGFSDFNGNTRNNLVRLNADGTEDTTFATSIGSGFSPGDVTVLSLQSDGKILVGGDFTTFNSATNAGLVRLNFDGTKDTAFATTLGTGFNNAVRALAIQSDGKIVAGGDFSTLNGVTVQNFLIRFNANGSIDTTFSTNLGTGFTSDGVYALSLQSDGKILVGGNFTTFNGATRNRLLRFNSSGTEDTSFYANLGTGLNNIIKTFSIQSDDKIIAGGTFTTLNGVTRNRLLRLTTTTILSSAVTTTGTSLVLTYGGSLDASSVPATTDFVVNVGGSPITVSGVGISGSAVTLSVTPVITNGQVVTVSYTPGASKITGGVGSVASSLSSQTVTNSVAAPVVQSSGGFVQVPYGCTDSKSINYSNPNYVNHDKSLCKYSNAINTSQNNNFSGSGSVCISIKGYMGRGDADGKNNVTEVRTLQNLLQIKGYLLATPNGYFGTGTQNAVKKFQKINNIRQTGNVGPLTIKALNNCAN